MLNLNAYKEHDVLLAENYNRLHRLEICLGTRVQVEPGAV